MTFVGEDGHEHRPFVVHRALLGSIERFFGILVEHYAGAFPVWLMPVQAMVIPIADRHNAYAQRVLEQLQAAGIRAEADLSTDRMNNKIRQAQVQKIPYMLVIGDREQEAGQVNLRLRDGSKPGALGVDGLIVQILDAIREHRVL
jgi:threonyl-tRNA synthetase